MVSPLRFLISFLLFSFSLLSQGQGSGSSLDDQLTTNEDTLRYGLWTLIPETGKNDQNYLNIISQLKQLPTLFQRSFVVSSAFKLNNIKLNVKLKCNFLLFITVCRR